MQWQLFLTRDPSCLNEYWFSECVASLDIGQLPSWIGGSLQRFCAIDCGRFYPKNIATLFLSSVDMQTLFPESQQNLSLSLDFDFSSQSPWHSSSTLIHLSPHLEIGKKSDHRWQVKVPKISLAVFYLFQPSLPGNPGWRHTCILIRMKCSNFFTILGSKRYEWWQ